MWRVFVARSFTGLFPLAALLCTSCSVTAPREINDQYHDAIEQRRTQYRVKDGDIVIMSIYAEEEGSQLGAQTFTILPDGRSDPFFMTNYKFGGKTLPEVEKDVQRLLSEEKGAQGLTPEKVSITLTPAGEQVYLTGQFEAPATVPLTTTMTLSQAVAAVSGLRVTGDTDYALLRRPYRDPLHPDIFRVDLNDINEDIVLLPNDQIHLPRNCLAGVINYMREFIFGIIPGQFYATGLAAAL